MKNTVMRLLAVILTVAMLCSMLPAMASAQETAEAPKEISKKSEAIIEADIWDKIESFENDNIIATRDDPVSEDDYAELSDEIEALVKQSETFVEGSIVRNGDFFTWETSEGIVCGYSPALRFKTRNNTETGEDKIETKSYATKASPTSKNVYLIAPYYGSDPSFTDQYKNEANSIAKATGGQYTLYQAANASITNIATAMQSGGVVIFDSHGITDYSNGDDYVSRANSSYICLKTSTGITNSDMSAVSGSYGTYYHAFNGGSGTYCVDGTAIKNHMSKAAPGTILWMAICLGMATGGLCTPMRNAGVEVVYGYSQSVSFTGDYEYETYFWNKMKAGSDVKTAISYMKSAAGSNWDPAYANYSLSSAKANYVAFPIVVSDQDSYPGQGKVDAVQTVYSTYKLFESGSSDSGSSDSGSSGSGATAEGGTFNLVTSASNLTAGDYIILAAANGTYAGDYSYYALTTEQDATYATMQSNGLNFNSLPTTLTCDDKNAGYFVYTLKGNANGFTLTTDLGSLEGGADSEGAYLYYGSATTWKASYNSTSKGFRLAGDGANMALRDDYSTMGSNGSPMFAASSSSGTTVMHMYKRETSGTTACSHSSTSTSTTPATCTTAGSTTVTCNSCGTVVSTSTIPATGHNITYTSNNDGTHDLYCSNCNGTGTADCTYTNNVCKYCGYNNSSSSDSDSETISFQLVTSASGLTSGEYLIMTTATGSYAGNYGYYVMTSAVDSQYAMLHGTGLNFDSLPTGLLLDASAYDTYVWIVNGNANGASWKTSGGTYLTANSANTSLTLANSSSNWTASYSSSKQGFTLSSLNRYLALRDDVSTTGDNGVCGYTTIAGVANSAYMHLYKRVDSETSCSHSDTSTSTTAATCTQAGQTLVICDDCGETVSSTTIPALGHDYTYTSNNNGTHKIGCSRCSYSKSENCTMVSGTCRYCGYSEEPELPDEPELPAQELAEGQYVIAAYVDGEYYAMSNAFASKIDGTVVTVIDGKVPAEDAIDYVITLSSADGGWVIESPDGSYLKYNSSTNLAKATEPYAWDISEGANGTWRVAAQTSGRGLVFRAKTYNQFGGYSTTNCTEGSAEYFDIELLPIDGEISEPELPECTHEATETVTEDPTCTESGTVTVICADCGEIISTTTVPATGHDFSYTGNGDGTHTGTCANCGDTDSGDCTDPEGVCDVCGADNTPDAPELPAQELKEGQFVIAALVDGNYYAMSNTFASKIDGTVVTVIDGKVLAEDAIDYVITLSSAEGGWVIESPDGSYLKYNSSTNLAKATEPYAWDISEGANGTWRVAAQTSGRGLVFRAKTYNQFGGYSTTNCTEGSAEYFDIELLPIDGEISEPEIPECTHEDTDTVTEDPTCTESGTVTVICADCGEIISTTTVPATGHDFSYTGNGDGTHTGTCANCGDTDSGDCTDPEGICDICGADNTPDEPELPDEPEVPAAELTEGQFVVAAYVDGKYYAMSNSFASKINGTEITVVDGKVPAAEAEGYVITLSSVDGAWVIEGPDGSYLKYNSSTNLAKATEPYAWDISEGSNGTWRVAAQTSGRGLVFRAKTYNQFGGYSTTNCTEGSAEYFDIEFLPIDGEIIEPEEPVCTHENTETLSIPATCTQEGTSTVTCTDCGEIISTTTTPATGHAYSYVGNGDGTHTGTCANCGDTDGGDCTDPEGVCDICGADNTPDEPELPEQPAIDLAEGRYVVAANANGVYYAMSNTFASKIGGTEIRVIDGKVAEADAEGFVITLTAVEGGWSIESTNGTYLKYASSTNLGASADPYAWIISEGTNGTWRIAAQTEGRGLIFRAKSYNQFGGYAPSNCNPGSAEYFDMELLPVADIAVEEETPEIFDVNIRHSLNLANDISINYLVAVGELADYSDFYLEVEIPNYVGNDYTGSYKVQIRPVEKSGYHYFVLEGMTAVQMNDMLKATLFASKDGELYASEVDVYSIGTYAYNQLVKNTAPAELKKLCAELIRYGSKAQLFKDYRTDDLVDETMTEEQKSLLVALEGVTFGNNNRVLEDLANPTVTWAGKSLDLNTKVVLRMIVNLSKYSGNMSDLSLRVTYVDLTGEELTVDIKDYKVYDASKGYYVFDFAELCAAELRAVVSMAVYEGDRQVSATLQYSADTYGNGKSGALLTTCQALIAYSDAALNYFSM